AKVAQEQVVEPKIDNPQPEEKPLGETMKDLFSKPVLPEMTDVHLPLNLNIQAFRGEQLRLTGDTDITIYNLLLKVSSIDGQMKLDALDVDSDQGKVTASGNAQLQDNWPVDITLNSTLNIDPLKGEKVQLKVGGEVRKKLTLGVDLNGPVAMTLRAETQLAEAGLPLDMEIKSKQLYWPFTGEKAYQADDLLLKFNGKMTDYTLTFSTAVKGQSLPPAKINLDAKGNEQQVNLDKLTVAALEGKTELKALLDWQQAISWRGELTLNGINTAKEVPDWPSKLNGLIKTQGSLYGGSWQMSVPELKITGNVKQNKVDVSGSLQGNSYMQWKIPGLHLALGPNSADVKGELGVKDLNLDATIDAPHLDNALPGLGGTAKGLVKVRGTVDAPQLLADITARALRWQELSVAQVNVKGDVKSTDQIGGSLDVRVDRISQPGVNISLVQLNAKGNEKQHDLQLRVQGDPVSGQLSLAGSFARKAERWKGTLSNTRFQTPVGPVALTRDI
ncbi:MAG: translocation and assembly module TamB, partial [Klebsiella sp.]|nr:translocation and assembly module TamB [Klebsiella sp.]